MILNLPQNLSHRIIHVLLMWNCLRRSLMVFRDKPQFFVFRVNLEVCPCLINGVSPLGHSSPSA